jgi:hypothetical protein
MQTIQFPRRSMTLQARRTAFWPADLLSGVARSRQVRREQRRIQADAGQMHSRCVFVTWHTLGRGNATVYDGPRRSSAAFGKQGDEVFDPRAVRPRPADRREVEGAALDGPAQLPCRSGLVPQLDIGHTDMPQCSGACAAVVLALGRAATRGGGPTRLEQFRIGLG